MIIMVIKNSGYEYYHSAIYGIIVRKCPANERISDMRKEWMGLIQRNSDGSETLNYNDESFPAYIHNGWIVPGATWGNVVHFHEDLEFVTVVDGRVGFSVNGKNIVLEKGESIMINSKQIHFIYTVNESKSKYIVYILHPRLLCSSFPVEQQYVDPIINNENVPYIHFKTGTSCAAKMETAAREMLASIGNNFLITKSFFVVWDIVINYMSAEICFDNVERNDQSVDIIKNMLDFTRENLDKNITLDDIAESGGVSKTYCNALFKKFTNRSPVENLLHTRVERVAELLLNTELPMSDIAEKTGFSGASYMSEIFKRYYKVSPREYRKRKGSVVDLIEKALEDKYCVKR